MLDMYKKINILNNIQIHNLPKLNVQLHNLPKFNIPKNT